MRIIWHAYPSVSKAWGSISIVPAVGTAIKRGWINLRSEGTIKAFRSGFSEGFLTKTLSRVTGDAASLRLANYSILGKGLQNQGLVFSLNKVLNLADVAVFVTTVESAFTAVSRVGAYVDVLSGVTNAASINRSARDAGFTTTQYLSELYSPLSEFDKSTLVWSWLFMKPNMSFGRGDLFVERDGKNLNAEKSFDNFALARAEVINHGTLEGAINNSQTLSSNIKNTVEQRKLSAIKSVVTPDTDAAAVIKDYNDGKTVSAGAKEVLDRFKNASSALDRGDVAGFREHLQEALTIAFDPGKRERDSVEYKLKNAGAELETAKKATSI